MPVSISHKLDESPLREKQLRLGFGCSGPWGEKWFSEKEAFSLVHEALRLGITRFDTAPFYGNGEAERRLGLALKETGADRSSVFLSSKTGTQKQNGKLVKDFSEAAILGDFDGTLARLCTEYLDIYYLHGPTSDELFNSLPVLEVLKQQGLIRKIGVCTEPVYAHHAFGNSAVDVVMATYNPLYRQLASHFDAAKTAGQELVTVASLAQGLYRKGLYTPRSLPDLWYLARGLMKNRRVMSLARSAPWLHEIEGWTAAQAMLAWTLQNQLIDVALTNTTKISHLRENVSAARKSLPSDLYRRIDEAFAQTS